VSGRVGTVHLRAGARSRGLTRAEPGIELVQTEYLRLKILTCMLPVF
jgi:hypothetical protein